MKKAPAKNGLVSSRRTARKRDFARTPEPQRRGASDRARRSAIRRAEARRDAAALRLQARARRRAEELGRAEGAELEPEGSPARRADRGSSARLRRLRRRDSRGRIRRGQRRDLGPRALAAARRRRRGLEGRQARFRARRSKGSRGALHSCAWPSAARETRQGQLAAAEAPRRSPEEREAAAPRARRKQATAARPEHCDGARKRGELPAKPSPQLATLVTRPPEGPGWLFEPKLDGYRVLCRKSTTSDVTVLTRRGNDWTDEFRNIADAVRALPCRAALIDGEAVVYDSHGVTSFQRLQNALKGDSSRIDLVAFDLLHLDGWDLTRAPLVERKALLERLLEGAAAGNPLRRARHRGRREVLRGGVQARARGHRREARRRSLSRARAHAQLAQGQVPAAAGVRHRRLHRSRRLAHGVRRAARRDARRRERAVALRRQGRHGLRRADAEVVARALEAARAKDAARREDVGTRRRARRALGRAGARRRDRLHRVDRRRPVAASDLRRPARGQDGGRGRRGARDAACPRRHALDSEADAPGENGAGQTHRASSRIPTKCCSPIPASRSASSPTTGRQSPTSHCRFSRSRPLTLFRCPDGYAAQCFYQKHVGVGVPAVVPRVAIKDGEDPYAVDRRRRVAARRSCRSACSSCTSGARAPSISTSPTSSCSISIRPPTCPGARSPRRP